MLTRIKRSPAAALVALPQVMAAGPACAQRPAYGVRGHDDSRGFWIPGDWA
jgi:hypothetical protein